MSLENLYSLDKVSKTVFIIFGAIENQSSLENLDNLKILEGFKFSSEFSKILVGLEILSLENLQNLSYFDKSEYFDEIEGN